MKTPRVLLLSPARSYRIAAYLDAARRLGVSLVIASDGRHSLAREVAAGIHLDLSDPAACLDTVARVHAETPFSGIVASDDTTVELAARLAESLGLAHNAPSAARLTRRKDLARQCLADAGVPVPAFSLIDLDRPLSPQLDALCWPVVLKPLSLSASTGVIRVDDADSARHALAVIAELIADLPDREERRRVLAERYLPGAEVAVEGFLHHGGYQAITIFDKPDPLTGPFFEETCYVSPSRLPEMLQRKIISTVADACAAYGLRQGPVHAELRIDGERAWILEVAARTIGGECSRALDAGLVEPLEMHVLASALGRPLPLRARERAAGVMMIPVPRAGVLRRVTGEAEARAVPGITGLRIAVRPGQPLEVLPRASSYLGFLFAEGDTPEVVEDALRSAHAALKFTVDPMILLRPGSLEL